MRTFLSSSIKIHLRWSENKVQPLDETPFLLLHPTLIVIHILGRIQQWLFDCHTENKARHSNQVSFYLTLVRQTRHKHNISAVLYSLMLLVIITNQLHLNG